MKTFDFKDKGFEQAIKAELGTTKERLTQQDIFGINGIVINTSSEKILPIPWLLDGSAFNMHKPDLYFNVAGSENGLWEEDLRFFTHISSLYLFVKVGDLGFLRQFSDLSDLYIAKGSTNEDWSFLRDLNHLTYLLIQDSSFSDLGVLQELAHSQEETSNMCKEPVLWKYKLSYLCLTSCGIKDVSALADCKWLTELDLSHNEITDFSPLLNLQMLYGLTLRYNRLSDLSFISKDSYYLEYLNLRHNDITDISPLNHMKEVNKLYLGHNPITNFSVLDQMQVRRHDIEGYNPHKRRG